MGLSDAQTHHVVEVLNEGFATCASVDLVYRPDCYQQAVRSGARLLGNNAGYWEAEVALTRVGRNLSGFVRSNTDKKASRIREGGMRIKAVTQSSLPEAEKLFEQNMRKAEQVMRSGSAAEQKYFAPIADLMGQHADAMSG